MDRVHDLLTVPWVAGPSRRYRGRLSSGVDGIRCLDSCTQRTMKRRSPPGGRTLPGFLRSSTYVLFTLIWPLLSSRFQTEFATNEHVTAPDVGNIHTFASDAYRGISSTETVPDVLHDVSNTRVAVSEVRNDIVNTRVIVSDIRPDAPKTRRDEDSQSQTVSTTCTSSFTRRRVTTYYCIDSCQVSNLDGR